MELAENYGKHTVDGQATFEVGALAAGSFGIITQLQTNADIYNTTLDVMCYMAAAYGAAKLAMRLTSLFKHAPQEEQPKNQADNNLEINKLPGIPRLEKLYDILNNQNITDNNAKYHFVVIDPNNSENLEIVHEKDLKKYRENGNNIIMAKFDNNELTLLNYQNKKLEEAIKTKQSLKALVFNYSRGQLSFQAEERKVINKKSEFSNTVKTTL